MGLSVGQCGGLRLAGQHRRKDARYYVNSGAIASGPMFSKAAAYRCSIGMPRKLQHEARFPRSARHRPPDAGRRQVMGQDRTSPWVHARCNPVEDRPCLHREELAQICRPAFNDPRVRVSAQRNRNTQYAPDHSSRHSLLHLSRYGRPPPWSVSAGQKARTKTRIHVIHKSNRVFSICSLCV